MVTDYTVYNDYKRKFSVALSIATSSSLKHALYQNHVEQTNFGQSFTLVSHLGKNFGGASLRLRILTSLNLRSTCERPLRGFAFALHV